MCVRCATADASSSFMHTHTQINLSELQQPSSNLFFVPLHEAKWIIICLMSSFQKLFLLAPCN